MNFNPFYAFILNMWIMQSITKEMVQLNVPKNISQEEADMILATPQGGHLDVQSVPNDTLK